jgi:hypothetical protein
LSGGLNVQDYESQLVATLSKWIFKLIDPRHVASWKALPFHFLEMQFPGTGLSIFLVKPIIVEGLGKTTNRWVSFLIAWLRSGLIVAEPPKDYHCILNESLWFNRHALLDPDRNSRGRSFVKSIENRLIKLGVTHVENLISSACQNEDKLYFISCEARTGSKVLAKALVNLVYEHVPLD